ncbi:MAG: flagellar basal-body rod protein FlgF [Parvularculaceae bacterium]
MGNVTYVSLSRQIALERELSLVANNVANAATTGYRREGSIFSEYIQGLRGDNNSVSQTRLAGATIDQTSGAYIQTGESLDVAISGPGFFVVETPRGERLTRKGDFQLNENNEIVSSAGDRLMGGGGAIVVPPGASRLTIATDGVVSADDAVISQIRIVDADATTLKRESGAMFEAVNGVEDSTDAKLRQGFVESSNVNPVLEISRLIEVQRAFEMQRQLANDEADRIRSAIESLSAAR